MKRIALLLAGALLGTGCVVESTCNTQSATVDWVFRAPNDTAYAGCTAAGVTGVNVYVDGYLEKSVTCTELGSVYLPALFPDSREIMVEGVDGGGFTLLRDWTTLNSCGETYFPSNPGEALVTFDPDYCFSGTSYLNYSLVDWSRSGSPQVMAEVIGATTLDSCAAGVTVTIPLGTYEFTGIEEVTSGGVRHYNGACNSTVYDVLAWNNDLFSVHMANSSACPLPSTW